MSTSPAAALPPLGDGAGSGRRRRRTRKRRGNRDAPPSPPPGGSGDPPVLSSSDDERPAGGDGVEQRRPQRVIARSAVISRREELLAGRALVLSVIADDPGDISELILPAIAHRFEIEENLLSLHNFGPAKFLLISPDEQSATRIFNNGRPLVVPPARLHLMRSSRFLHSEAAIFSSAVEVELRGIPAHGWDVETASQLLGDGCVPCDIHPETGTQRQVFRLAAWRSSPSSIPPLIDLVIPESAVAGGGEEQGKRTLCYPVKIAVVVHGMPADAPPPPPPPSSDSDRHRRRRWVRRTSASSPTPVAADRPGPSGGAHGASVRSRLGPPSIGHRGGRDDVSAPAPPIGRRCDENPEDALPPELDIDGRVPLVALGAQPVPAAEAEPAVTVAATSTGEVEKESAALVPNAPLPPMTAITVAARLLVERCRLPWFPMPHLLRRRQSRGPRTTPRGPRPQLIRLWFRYPW
ncbi:hypothetical protein C2845_PM09G14320 [Panicum miliaceum]|uniref:DUF4283 domain-containing protein n=1 Tax=Panicum miliaceum TaxID=4540 RepID=A0A3L6S0D2_PANMI|nr:hypothetical protein C2845_PM09G14320 [Panicum miliaceum]